MVLRGNEERRAQRVMCGRIAQMVLEIKPNLSGRDAASLLEHKLIHIKTDTGGQHADVDLIERAVGSQIADGNVGPLVFCANPDGTSRKVIRAEDLICDEDARTRAQAKRFLAWVVGQHGVAYPATIAAVQEHASQQGDESEWRGRAIALAETLNDDWMLNVAGIRQSIAADFNRGFNDYLNASLRPGTSVLHSGLVSATLPDPKDGALAESFANKSLPGSSLIAATEQYLATHRHLPWSGRASLGSFVAAGGHSGSSVWNVLRPLASQSPSMLSRYHACEALLANPSAIPEEHWKAFADVVWDIAASSSPNSRAAWRLCLHLAGHFICYLELHAPVSDGEGLAGLAWWMSDQVVSVIIEAGIDCDRLLPEIEAKATTGVRVAWEITQPRYGPSAMRTLTVNGISPWGAALLGRIGDGELLERIVESNADERGKRMRMLLSLGVNMTAQSPADSGRFAFESFGGVMTSLAHIAESDDERSLAAAWVPGGSMAICDDLAGLLEAISRNSVPLSTWAAVALSTRGKSGFIDAVAMWSTLSSDEWRDKVWPTLDPDIAKHVVDALIEVAVQARPVWSAELPHLIAGFIERRLKEGSDVEFLFAQSIRASCALHVGSALRRVLRNPAAYRLRPLIEQFRTNALGAVRYGGMWASGHIRATLIDLIP